MSPLPMLSSPWPRTHTYGTDSSSVTGHGESAARNLPTTIWRGLAGVSSRGSRVARSRSPLKLSAAITNPTNRPNEMLLRMVRNTISTGGIRFSWLSSSRSTEVTDMTAVKRIRSMSTRPPVHRSTNSRLNTSHHTGAARLWRPMARLERSWVALIGAPPCWSVPGELAGPRRTPLGHHPRRRQPQAGAAYPKSAPRASARAMAGSMRGRATPATAAPPARTLLRSWSRPRRGREA